MVKPSLEGSSVGLTKVKAVEELKSAVDYALKFDNTIADMTCKFGIETMYNSWHNYQRITRVK